MKKNTVRYTIFGAIVILVGIVWLIANLMEIEVNLAILWPLLILVPGVVVLLRYAFSVKKKINWQHLLVGSFLVQLGLVFLANALLYNLAGFVNIWYLSLFTYPAIAAISLWITWFASGRKITLLVGAIILTAIAVLVSCFSIITTVFNEILGPDNISLLNGIFWPLLMVGVGLAIIVWPFIVQLMQNPESKPVNSKSHDTISSDDDI